MAWVFSLVGAFVVLGWRMLETRRPLNLKKIIIPPLGMSTGFCMFFAPWTRVPWEWGLIAFLLGACVFSLPMVLTTHLRREGDAIYGTRSFGFIVAMLVLVVIRIGLRGYIEQYVSFVQTGSLFYLLAFGMVLVWRLNMLRLYLQLTRGPK